ncbi:hypothetical protein J2T13_005126 [Paenibacillus sp. DS2015]|uniref:hypothetical protein n=1 Tax=Paenibacillus sp. DS2015 TaxID=3373917 RepID=UPI003D20E0A0
MALQYIEKVHGITITADKEDQIPTISRLIYSGILLYIVEAGEIITVEPRYNEGLIEGCIYRVSTLSDDSQLQGLLVRIPNMRVALTPIDIEYGLPKLTFRCGKDYGIYVLSSENDIIHFTNDVSQVEIIGIS